MPNEKTPLLRLRRLNGEMQELTIGPCAGRMLLGIVGITVLALLLLSRVIDWHDVAPALWRLARF